MNSGTETVAPVSTVAGFWTLPLVSPRTPGSEAVTSRNTNVGSATSTGRSLKNSTVHGRLSFMRSEASPISSALTVTCSKLDWSMKTRSVPSL